MANPQLTVEIGASIDALKKGMRNALGEINKFGSSADKAVDKISTGITSNLAGIFSTAAIIGFGKEVIRVTADFEKYNAVLGNTLGSSELATLKLKELSEFAAKTPFSVNELTASFVKLANGGFKPTNDQIRALGDLAASTGKSFDQLAEAILDAQTGEFERLKEFGIRAKDAGDNVIFTYKGVQTQVEKTSGAIRDYITNLGNAEGVSGSMAKISETLGGRISNLGDSWDRMLLSVGGNTKGVFNSAITEIGKLIDKITEFNEELSTIEKYGLKSDLGEKINRVINPFASRITNTEFAAFNIKEAEKNVTSIVSATISGAKSVNDFGKALARLKKEADANINERAVARVDDPNYRKVQLAVKNEYQIGIKAIQDARKAFLEEQGKVEGNFGKGAKDDADKIAEIYKRLAAELKSNPLAFGSTKDDVAEENIRSYQTAINDLVKNGYEPASKAVQDLINKQNELWNSATNNGGGSLAPSTGGNVRAGTGLMPSAEIIPEEFTVSLTEFANLTKKAQESYENFVTSVQELSMGSLAPTISDAFGSIGEALANGTNAIDAFGSAILSAISSFLSQLGKMFIQEGIAQIGYGIAKNLILPGSGARNIAGGIGMIAAGSLISVASGAAGAKNRGNASNSGGNTPIRQFATGGYNLPAGMALVGERGPEIVDLPTGSSVFNNAKTGRLLGNGGTNITLAGEVGITMQTLYFKLKEVEKEVDR